MRIARLAVCAVAVTTLSVAPVYAQGRGHGGGHSTTSHGGSHTTTTAHGGPHASSPTTTGKTTHGNPHEAATTTSAPAAGGTSSTGTSSTGATGASTAGTSSTTTTQLNPIAQKISAKPQLASKLSAMLPSGMTLNQASAGFKNQGQFIAALHVSRNLNIPFADLKAAMLGTPKPAAAPPPSTPGTIGTTATTTPTTTTSSSPMSLGQAIHKLRPSVNSTTEAGRATTQAVGDLQATSASSSTNTTSTTTSTTTSPTKKHGR